ncbi:MAG: phytanoyl-CoA dioxygenase family protein [Lentisphaeria bacterium]|nr:phytanoyl-CoA dioxygenase family protein [Lentisphaeria bacterium]NQZ69159.1 phytanoyl-CoA dioxygenase family protein [Lentisphaeria bacterium]
MLELTEEQFDFYKRNGYVFLEPLDASELAHFKELYHSDRSNFGWSWYTNSCQTINCDSLMTTPEFDGIIRHPRVLNALEDLMGAPACFSEICIRHMTAFDGEPDKGGWHRDRPHWLEHPLRIDYMQLMVYLTDVDESTHCFAISPEAFDDEILEIEDQLEKRGEVDIHGPAGSLVLFNMSHVHRAHQRVTKKERHTLQIYYGHLERPFLSNDSIIPAQFWRDHEDPEVRKFYGKLNAKTELFLDDLKSKD